MTASNYYYFLHSKGSIICLMPTLMVLINVSDLCPSRKSTKSISVVLVPIWIFL